MSGSKGRWFICAVPVTIVILVTSCQMEQEVQGDHQQDSFLASDKADTAGVGEDSTWEQEDSVSTCSTSSPSDKLEGAVRAWCRSQGYDFGYTTVREVEVSADRMIAGVRTGSYAGTRDRTTNHVLFFDGTGNLVTDVPGSFTATFPDGRLLVDFALAQIPTNEHNLYSLRSSYGAVTIEGDVLPWRRDDCGGAPVGQPTGGADRQLLLPLSDGYFMCLFESKPINLYRMNAAVFDSDGNNRPLCEFGMISSFF